MRPDLLGYWVAEDGCKSVLIRGRRATEADSKHRFPVLESRPTEPGGPGVNHEIEHGKKGWFKVTVFEGLGPATHVVARPAEWHPCQPEAAASDNARKRLDALVAEMGEKYLGTTYRLMFARSNRDPKSHGGFNWIAIEDSTPIEDVRILPEGGASYWEAVLGAYDDFVEELNSFDDWMMPLTSYRRATKEEENTLRNRQKALQF
ncbi:MAG: hypothetical protein HN348_05180 [Proteobacteria bacterium]|jgi:hypothetical protein|nr:hypothetical protein [Pseudomonadota bacterium]